MIYKIKRFSSRKRKEILNLEEWNVVNGIKPLKITTDFIFKNDEIYESHRFQKKRHI